MQDLSLAWVFPTEQDAPIKSSPLLVNGVVYFTVPENIWAVDARSGQQIWHFKYPPSKGSHIGNRGVGIYKGWLYFCTPDDQLISLDAKDGHVRWKIKIGEVNKGQSMTMAPFVVGDHVLVGVSGPYDNLRQFIRSVDPVNGATLIFPLARGLRGGQFLGFLSPIPRQV